MTPLTDPQRQALEKMLSPIVHGRSADQAAAGNAGNPDVKEEAEKVLGLLFGQAGLWLADGRSKDDIMAEINQMTALSDPDCQAVLNSMVRGHLDGLVSGLVKKFVASGAAAQEGSPAQTTSISGLLRLIVRTVLVIFGSLLTISAIGGILFGGGMESLISLLVGAGLLFLFWILRSKKQAGR